MVVVMAVSVNTSGQTKDNGMAKRKLEYRIRNITWLMDKAGRLDWAHNKKGLIAFDSRGPDGYYDVYIANPDGSGRTCLTCDRAGAIPQRHIGNPAWHPNGEYIVFQAEKEEHPADSAGATLGGGLWSDLWLMTGDGKNFHQLTNIPTDRVQGVLHPHFSHDGSKLLWAERIRGFQQAENFGEWCVKIAAFSFRDKPSLTNIRTFQPGKRHMWHETHGFSPADSRVIFSGDLDQGQEIDGMDIYTLDLSTEELKNLTSSMHSWDEHAHFSPAGDKIIWMSNLGFPGRRSLPWFKFMQWLATELWMMNPDGTGKRRLTYFNDPNHPHYRGGRAIVGDGDWNHEGDKYAALVNILKPGIWEEWIIIIEFD